MDFAGFLIGAAGYVVGSGGWSHREKRLHEASLSPIAPCASSRQNAPRKLGEHPLVQETRVPLFRPKMALVNFEEVFHHLERVRWLHHRPADLVNGAHPRGCSRALVTPSAKAITVRFTVK
jgi:hypothetical protein